MAEKTIPVAAHHQTAGWAGVPGQCGVECACGWTLDGFDTIAEAAALLDDHIAAAAPVPVAARWDPTSPQHTVIRAAINWRKWYGNTRPAYDLAAAVDALPHIGEPARDPSQPTPPFPLAEGDTVTVTMPARVAGQPDPEADPGAADELWDFAITVAGETEYVSLTQAEVIARVRKP